MDQPHVVIVAYPGMQSLDAIGPYEVFAGATRAAAMLGAGGGYEVTVARSGPDCRRAALATPVLKPE